MLDKPYFLKSSGRSFKAMERERELYKGSREERRRNIGMTLIAAHLNAEIVLVVTV